MFYFCKILLSVSYFQRPHHPESKILVKMQIGIWENIKLTNCICSAGIHSNMFKTKAWWLIACPQVSVYTKLWSLRLYYHKPPAKPSKFLKLYSFLLTSSRSSNSPGNLCSTSLEKIWSQKEHYDEQQTEQKKKKIARLKLIMLLLNFEST